MEVRSSGHGEEGDHSRDDADHGEHNAAHEEEAKGVGRVGLEDLRNGMIQGGEGEEDANGKGNPLIQDGDGIEDMKQIEGPRA